MDRTPHNELQISPSNCW